MSQTDPATALGKSILFHFVLFWRDVADNADALPRCHQKVLFYSLCSLSPFQCAFHTENLLFFRKWLSGYQLPFLPEVPGDLSPHVLPLLPLTKVWFKGWKDESPLSFPQAGITQLFREPVGSSWRSLLWDCAWHSTRVTKLSWFAWDYLRLSTDSPMSPEIPTLEQTRMVGHCKWNSCLDSSLSVFCYLYSPTGFP